MVVRADRDLDSLREQGPDWMCAQVMHIAEDLVRNGAAFNANVFLLDHLDEVWAHDQAEAVTNSLRAQKDCVMQLRVAARVRFT